LLDGTAFPDGETLKTIRTLPVVAKLVGCDEKTVRRALKTNNVVKGKWLVKELGKASQHLSGKQDKSE